MGLFRRGTKVVLELEPDELREVQSLTYDTQTMGELLDRYPNCWPLIWGVIPEILEDGDVVQGYHCAKRCLELRPEDPRSKMALVHVYQYLSMAAMSNAAGDVETVHRAHGHTGPINDPSVSAQQAADALGLDIDDILADSKLLLDHMLTLNLDSGARKLMHRFVNLNHLHRDWRSGKIQRRMEQLRD